MRYKFQADWQPYAFDESNAFLTSDQAVESILSPVDTTKFPFTSSGIPLRVVDNCAYVNNNTENTIIFGETDSMKTRSAVRPLIAMAAGARESMVVTDVKGELASDAKLRKLLETLGYRTVFMDFALVLLTDTTCWNIRSGCIAMAYMTKRWLALHLSLVH